MIEKLLISRTCDVERMGHPMLGLGGSTWYFSKFKKVNELATGGNLPSDVNRMPESRPHGRLWLERGLTAMAGCYPCYFDWHRMEFL